MVIQVTVSDNELRRVAGILEDTTRIPFEEVMDLLPGFLAEGVRMELLELTLNEDVQLNFVSYVMAERKAKATANEEAQAVAATR